MPVVLDNLESGTDAYSGLKSAAKAFLSSGSASDAKALTNYITTELGGSGGGRGRGYNPNALADVSL